MTRIALVAALAALLLFLLLARRLRPRVGPGAGLLQATLLSLFLSLSGAFLAIRVTDTPAEALRSLIVLADAAAARRDPAAVRDEIARLPRGARTRLALFEPRGAPAARGAAPPEGLHPEARFSSLDAALGWAALEAREASLPEVLLLGGGAGPSAVPEGLALTRVPLPAPVHRDRIGPLRLAPLVFAERTVTVRASVRTPAGPWTLRLLVDDVPRDARSGKGVSEETAEPTFTFPAGRPGTHRLVLALTGEDGVEIDREYGECAVRPFPRLAYVAPGGAAGPLERLLASSGYPLERAGLEDLAAGKLPAAADLILLEDVPAARLSWPAVSALSRAAAWDGRGLLFVGGPRSFTAGGYKDAPVERLLPLTMGIRDPKEEKHRTALVIVLDTSWSMLCPPEGCAKDAERMFGSGAREPRGPRIRKIDLARQSLLELLPAMKQVDYFGILGVRTAPYWELEPGVFADPAVVEERVRRIAPSGSGILLYSALLEASKSVTALDADVKHILVLLDTDDIDEIRVLGVGTVEDLIGELARKRVSVSFVGFGFSDDRYVPLLHQLAASTGGSLYLSSDVTSIPRFLREDREGLAGRQALRRHLETRHDEAAFPGLAGTPPVEGVFITEAKDDARTAVWTELGYPLIALRRIERGSVGAFASDGGRDLAPAWAAPAARETWDAVLASLLPRDRAAGALFLSREGGGASIWWRGATGGVPPLAAVADPEGKRAFAVFREVYPGSWRAELAGLPPGSHQVSVTPPGQGAQTLSFAVRPPEPPGRFARPDLGRFAPPPARNPRDGRVLPLLLILAAASFIAYDLVREHD